MDLSACADDRNTWKSLLFELECGKNAFFEVRNEIYRIFFSCV